MERMGTVEQQVSDLEDGWKLEVRQKKALDRLESFENQSRRQNVRIVGLKELSISLKSGYQMY